MERQFANFLSDQNFVSMAAMRIIWLPALVAVTNYRRRAYHTNKTRSRRIL